MDRVQLWWKVFTMACLFSMGLASNCNWKTQYEHQGQCCNACPKGTHPREPCSTQCVNCTATNRWCSCGDMPLCEDENCSDCVALPQCKGGQVLRRTGAFLFTYICEECPENTHSDEEKGTCEPIVDCKNFGLGVLFPGNRTHNARCGWQEPLMKPHSNQWMQEVIVVCLAINGLMCLALLVNSCVGRSKNKGRKTKRCSATHSRILSNECICKLSKEEMGDTDECETDDCSSKCEV